MIYIISSVIFFIIIFTLSKYSKNFHLIDFPNKRKIHSKPTSIAGGLSIFLTIFTITAFLSLSLDVMVIIYSCSLVLIVGLYDDIFDLNPKKRLVYQIVISILIYIYGIRIVNLDGLLNFQNFHGVISFSILFFLTIFSILCLINSFNFIDGLDGLCISNAIISFITIIILININSKSVDNYLYLFLFILILFIFFNFGILNIKTFLGDSGSTSLGFLIALLLIFYSMPDQKLLFAAQVIWCSTLPMFDFGRIITTRFFLNKKISIPDKNHVHHIFINIGLTKFQTLFLLITISIVLNAIGLIVYFNFGDYWSLFTYITLFFIYFFIINSFNSKIL